MGNKSRFIKLTQGKLARVDSEDYADVKRYNWFAVKDNNTYYAYSTFGGQLKRMPMHRFLMCAMPGQIIDHKNGNGLDNRKTNMRFCTTQQNGFNRKKSIGTLSKYKGVSWHKRDKKWVAQIRIKPRLIHLGYFDSEIMAARAYQKAAKKLYGEFANIRRIEEAE